MQSDFLKQYGWNSYSKDLNSKSNSLSPGRVVLQHRNKFRLISEQGEIWVRSAGNSPNKDKPISGQLTAERSGIVPTRSTPISKTNTIFCL